MWRENSATCFESGGFNGRIHRIARHRSRWTGKFQFGDQVVRMPGSSANYVRRGEKGARPVVEFGSSALSPRADYAAVHGTGRSRGRRADYSTARTRIQAAAGIASGPVSTNPSGWRIRETDISAAALLLRRVPDGHRPGLASLGCTKHEYESRGEKAWSG